MDAFIAKHADKLQGTLSCFDRVLFRGCLPFYSGYAMASFLDSRGICRREVKRFVLTQAYRLKDHARQMAAREGRPYQYFGERTRKEDLARQVAERDGIVGGPGLYLRRGRIVPHVFPPVARAPRSNSGSCTSPLSTRRQRDEVRTLHRKKRRIYEGRIYTLRATALVVFGMILLAREGRRRAVVYLLVAWVALSRAPFWHRASVFGRDSPAPGVVSAVGVERCL